MYEQLINIDFGSNLRNGDKVNLKYNEKCCAIDLHSYNNFSETAPPSVFGVLEQQKYKIQFTYWQKMTSLTASGWSSETEPRTMFKADIIGDHVPAAAEHVIINLDPITHSFRCYSNVVKKPERSLLGMNGAAFGLTHQLASFLVSALIGCYIWMERELRKNGQSYGQICGLVCNPGELIGQVRGKRS